MANTASSKTKQRFWDAWVDRRSSVSRSHHLHHRNLYVLPTGSGSAFIFLALIVWLLGTNYQNNLILALSYLQFSLVVVAILRTYNNMSGLRIESLGSSDGHAGANVVFHFSATRSDRSGSHSIAASWRGAAPTVFDVEVARPERLLIVAHAQRRGRLIAPRLLLQSEYPLGLVKCWTWLRFDNEALVYPAPLASTEPASTGGGSEGIGKLSQVAGDEFQGYSQYLPGQPLRRVDWKQYARERGMLTKLYGDERHTSARLLWQDFFDGDTERTLSRMTYCAIELHHEGVAFALELPGAEVKRGDDDAHLATVLRALALHRQS